MAIIFLMVTQQPKVLMWLLLFMLIVMGSSQSCPVLCGCDTNSTVCSYCYISFTADSDVTDPVGGACGCPVGLYFDSTTKLCDIRCKNCSNLTTCNECLEDFVWNSTSKQCEIATPYSYRIVEEVTNSHLTKAQVYGYIPKSMPATSTFLNYFTTCAALNETVFGGTQFAYNGTITKSFYGLPRHQWMRVRFDFIAMDDWRNDTLYLAMDGSCNYD